MKSISKLFKFLTLILLIFSIGLQNVRPAHAEDLLGQTITVIISPPASAAYGESFTVEAAASSGLEVAYSALGACTNDGATFTMTSGSGSCTVQYDQAGDGTYNPAAQVTEEVAAQLAAVTVTADAKTKIYSAADPALTYAVTAGALVGSDDFSGALARDPGEDVGDYAITQGTLVLSDNYDLTFIGATLVITAPETATPTPTSEPATATPTVSPTTATPTRIPPIKKKVIGPGLFVSTNGNDQSGANTCSNAASPCRTIQQAVTKASSGDTIYVAAGTFNGTGTSPIVTINKNVSISGGWDGGFDTQTSLTTLDGQDIRSDVVVNSGVTAAIQKFIITNSQASGIHNLGTLTVEGSRIHNNDKPEPKLDPEPDGPSASDGGGIYNTGTLVVVNTAIYGHQANERSGGGIFNTGSLTVTNSTIANNFALHGGGIMYTPTGYAGTDPSVVLNNVTIKGNSGPHGSGIYRAADNETVSLDDPVLHNSIMANNTCHGAIIAANNNLIYQSSGCTINGSLTTNPLLGSFSTANGYFPLLRGSPAIDAGSPSTPGSGGGACETTDQLGTTRPTDGNANTVAVCDIGAYEADPSVAGLTPVVNSIDIDDGSPQSIEVGAAFPTQLSALVKDQFGNPISGITVTFTSPSSGASGTFSDSGTNITTAITDASGIATAAVFTANGNVGGYSVNGSVSGMSNFVQFHLVNFARIEINGGSPQSRPTTGSFPIQLSVLVRDASNAPSSGVTVTFEAPSNGASGTFSSSGTNTTTAVTNAHGIATAAVFTANAVEGSYTVSASVVGIATQVQFQLINSPNVFYVSPNGGDSNTCMSPAQACLTINSALAKAGTGGTINIAVGTYTGTGSEVVSIQKNITLAGGWNLGFTSRNGESIIDGQNARDGIYAEATANLSQLIVQNSDIGILNEGSLTLNRIALINNKNGIYNVDGNADFLNSTFSGNHGSGLAGLAISNVGGTVTVRNSTIVNNLGYYSEAIYSMNGGAQVIIGNSILALNSSGTSSNCVADAWNISSEGYNIFDSAYPCGSFGGDDFVPASTDLIIESDLRLGSLEPAGYHALLGGSPAIDAANPVCSAILTDQRGIQRPQGPACDIGAYEVYGPLVASVVRENSSPTGAEQVNFTVTFSKSVTGVDTIAPFSDFILTTSGSLTGASIASVSGSGDSYTVSVNPGSGNGDIRLDVIDDDSIQDTSATPLGGPGLENGNFTLGETYIISNTKISSIIRANPNPASASTVRFTLTFNETVTGVNTTTPFNDFILKTTGVTGAAITGVSGSGTTYTITVKTGSGNGTIRLDIVDDDSIQDASGNPLGGVGLGNGNYISGQRYQITSIPTLQWPTGKITDSTPTYKWTKVPNATKYHYQLVNGATIVYSKIIASNICGATTYCLNTPTNNLKNAIYKWRVRAMVNGMWKSYSAYKTFTVAAPLPPLAGFWRGDTDLYVTSDKKYVKNYAMYFNVRECGIYNRKLVFTPLVPIKSDNSFAYNGTFFFGGTFKTTTRMEGYVGLNSYYIPGCGYISGGPFSVINIWINATQPPSAQVDEFVLTTVEATLNASSRFFDIDLLRP